MRRQCVQRIDLPLYGFKSALKLLHPPADLNRGPNQGRMNRVALMQNTKYPIFIDLTSTSRGAIKVAVIRRSGPRSLKGGWGAGTEAERPSARQLNVTGTEVF